MRDPTRPTPPEGQRIAINQWLPYRPVGAWRDYLHGARVYIALSLFAKSLLAWQIFANTLV